MAERLQIIRSEDYDWIGLYRNGKLLHEGHSIQEEDLVKLLGFEYDHVEWSQEKFEEHGGRCPDEFPSPYRKISVPGFENIDYVGNMPYGKGDDFDRKAFNSCARCKTDEHVQFFNCDAMWGDGDLICTNCNGYVRVRDSG